MCGLKISPNQRYYFGQLSSETHFTEELNFALTTQCYPFLVGPTVLRGSML